MVHYSDIPSVFHGVVSNKKTETNERAPNENIVQNHLNIALLNLF